MNASDRQDYFSETRGIAALWAGMLLAPLAWVIQLSVMYGATNWACRGGSTSLLHITSAGALLLALVGLALAARNWRMLGTTWPGDGAGTATRSRFLSAGGLVLSAFFSLVVIALWIPVFLLHPCLT